MVLPRYGKNLNDVFKKRNAIFSKKQIYSLGIQLVNILERIHDAGLVYNDLKLDNLMLDYDMANSQKQLLNDDEMFEKGHINLVDFGFATSYLADGKKEHIQKSEVAFYRGNFIFSSINQLKYRTTSRRDDIHSLFYLIVYLLN